jgi:hypothetical protein
MGLPLTSVHYYLVYYPPHALRDIFNPGCFFGRAITPDADRFPHLNSESQTAFDIQSAVSCLSPCHILVFLVLRELWYPTFNLVVYLMSILISPIPDMSSAFHAVF